MGVGWIGPWRDGRGELIPWAALGPVRRRQAIECAGEIADECARLAEGSDLARELREASRWAEGPAAR